MTDFPKHEKSCDCNKCEDKKEAAQDYKHGQQMKKYFVKLKKCDYCKWAQTEPKMRKWQDHIAEKHKDKRVYKL